MCLQEYTGIDSKRLEQMEMRLKNDILQESKSYRCISPPGALKPKASPHAVLPLSHSPSARHVLLPAEIAEGPTCQALESTELCVFRRVHGTCGPEAGGDALC